MTTVYERRREMIDAAAGWALDDIVLGDGEIAIQRDSAVYVIKFGDGSSTFTSLPVALEMLFSRSTVDTDDIINANSGQFGVGTDPVNKFSVYGGDYTSGVYRGAVVTDGQNLGIFASGALSEGAVLSVGALIRGQAYGDWTATNFGAGWSFLVTAENAVVPTKAMTLADDGSLLIGTVTKGASKLVVNDDSIQVNTSKTPASATDTGTKGQICYDANYIYVCTATDVWVRAATATW